MADISKISPDAGTTEYNVKDATARSDIASIVEKIPVNASSSNKFATASDIPTVPTALADLTDDSTHRLVTDTEKTAWNGNTTDIATINGLIPSGASTSNKLATASDIPTVPTTDQTYDATSTNPQSGTAVASAISGKADTSDIPTALADLTDDSTHRVVTDTEKTTWSGKQNALTFDNAPTANSNNPVKSGGIKTAIDNSFSASETEIKDTVGWTGKNKLQIPSSVTTQTINGVTFTVTRNADGEVTEIDVDGTASTDINFNLDDAFVIDNGDYILSGCPDGGTVDTYNFWAALRHIDSTPTAFATDIGNGVSLTVDSNISNLGIKIKVANGVTVNHLKFYPMLRDASISDSTYEPYHPSVEKVVEQVYADNAASGVHNWFDPDMLRDEPYTAHSSTNRGKYIRVYSTSDRNHRRSHSHLRIEPHRNYKVTCHVNITSGKAVVDIENVSESTSLVQSPVLSESGDIELVFNSGSYEEIAIRLFCTWDTAEAGDVTFENLVISLESDTYSSFTPYATPNMYLTPIDILDKFSTISGATINTAKSYAFRMGRLVVCAFNITELTISANGKVLSVDKEICPNIGASQLIGIRPAGESNMKIGFFNVGTGGGEISCGVALNNSSVTLATSWVIDMTNKLS